MALNKCKEYNLLSPLYKLGYRGGCFFCFNANIERYVHIRKNYPKYWEALKKTYYESNSIYFKYDKTLQEVEKEMDAYELNEKLQLRLF